MSKYVVEPTGRERTFEEDEVIVSKTDPKGWITYANSVFMKVALYGEDEVMNRPHSLVRHPDMPRCVFKLAWDKLLAGQEVFAYVKNMAKNGDFYWVFAHMTPTLGPSGEIVGYHSNRRKPRPEALAAIEPVYRDLLAEEGRHSDPKAGMQAASDQLMALLSDRGLDYDAFVFSI